MHHFKVLWVMYTSVNCMCNLDIEGRLTTSASSVEVSFFPLISFPLFWMQLFKLHGKDYVYPFDIFMSYSNIIRMVLLYSWFVQWKIHHDLQQYVWVDFIQGIQIGSISYNCIWQIIQCKNKHLVHVNSTHFNWLLFSCFFRAITACQVVVYIFPAVLEKNKTKLCISEL